MSTRANIILKDGREKLYFYRHSDGYPEGAMPTLNKFLDLIKDGSIRNNISQCSGWLVLLGRQEYEGEDFFKSEHYKWKIGAIEPTTGLHGDVEYIYIIDLEKKTIEVRETTGAFWDKPILKHTKKVRV